MRGGQHYGAGAGGPADEEQPYDPRAYAPNPEEPYGYDDDGNPLFYEPEQPTLKGGRSGLVLIGAVLAVALLGGAGAVAYKMMGAGGLSGEPPLIRADSEPIKTVPENSTPDAPPNKAVYDRVDSTPSKSKVVSREEEPVDLPSSPASQPHADGARVILPSTAAVPAKPAGDEPRRVKTMTIKPDATYAAAEPSKPAPTTDQIADAARPGQPPRGEFDNGIMAEGAAPSSEPKLAATPRAAPQQPAPAPASRPATPAPVARAATPPAAPAPAARSEPQQVAAIAPRAPVPAPAAQRAAGGGFVVQVTSQRTEQDARSAFASLQKRFPQVLGSYQPSIQSASVGDRGTYYRVRVGPFTNSGDASTVCNNLRTAGGDCVVSRN